MIGWNSLPARFLLSRSNHLHPQLIMAGHYACISLIFSSEIRYCLHLYSTEQVVDIFASAVVN